MHENALEFCGSVASATMKWSKEMEEAQEFAEYV